MKALLLDLDDTLLDYTGGVEESWTQACASGCADGRTVDVRQLAAALVGVRRWFWDDPERNKKERLHMLGAWTKIVAHALAEVGSADDALAEAIAREYAARRRERMRLFPEALACLDGWKRAGLPLALVTNGDAVQQRDKIERWDLARFFDVIVIEGEFGTGKPDEAVFRHALGKVGVGPADAVMVGDNLEFDVDGAQRIGLRGVWIDRHERGLPAGTTVAPWKIVRSLTDL